MDQFIIAFLQALAAYLFIGLMPFVTPFAILFAVKFIFSGDKEVVRVCDWCIRKLWWAYTQLIRFPITLIAGQPKKKGGH